MEKDISSFLDEKFEELMVELGYADNREFLKLKAFFLAGASAHQDWVSIRVRANQFIKKQ